MSYLTQDQLRRALTLADLTDAAYGPHAIQLLVRSSSPPCATRGTARRSSIAPAASSTSPTTTTARLSARGPARDARYTRYVDARRMLRSHTSALIPRRPARAAPTPPDDVLVCAPGLVYRRDAIDRLHVGKPHQLDLWRVRRGRSARPTWSR